MAPEDRDSLQDDVPKDLLGDSEIILGHLYWSESSLIFRVPFDTVRTPADGLKRKVKSWYFEECPDQKTRNQDPQSSASKKSKEPLRKLPFRSLPNVLKTSLCSGTWTI